MRSGFTISLKMLLFGYFAPSGPRMTCFHMPPTRKSIVSVVVLKPRGPHQFTTCLGLVIASHTSSRGASKTREMTISRSLVSFGFIVLLLGFNCDIHRRRERSLKQAFQLVKTAAPSVTVPVSLFNVREAFVPQVHLRPAVQFQELHRHERFARPHAGMILPAPGVD